VTKKNGETATFTVVAEGGSGSYTYKWYYRNPNTTGDSFKPSSTTTNKYSIKASTSSHSKGFFVYCVVSDGSNTVTSEIAELTVGTPMPLAIKTQPESVEKKNGETAVFTVEAEGGSGSYTYKWYYKNPNTTGDTFKLSTNKTNSYSIKANESSHDKGFFVYCVVSDGSTSVTSETAELTIESHDFTENDITYTKLSDTTCAVVKYNGSASSVIVPETVNGLTVVEIGESAFEGNTSLQSIDLPDSITVIRKAAFKGCTNLGEMK
jgi:uncharacterized protein involved in tellurium resistance